MKSDIRVATPPPRPLLVFDGDCNFCTFWVRRWQLRTGETVDYLPAQDPRIAARFPEIPAGQFNTAVQLIEPDGQVYAGAEAVFRTLAQNASRQWPLNIYEKAPFFARLTEWAYGVVAENRSFFSLLTRWFWGRHLEQPAHFLTRWIFLRGLGFIYLVAFLSLWSQINGLIGHNGILPANQFMTAVQQQCNAQGIGWERYHLLPTLCWLDSSDNFLHFQCAAGSVLALLLIFGIAPAPCLALLWLLYLSLVTVGREFLGFQWDNLLLEAGFLAIFLAPLQLLPRASRETPPSRMVLWLLWLLLFKVMFSSGCVKLLSGDPNWCNLTALTFHYQTQPLPTWIGWYAHQLPVWFQKLSCAGMFGIELGAPLLIFAPRRLRFCGGAAIVFLQILILLTGNYTFFNWLTLALCLLLLDDFVLNKFMPARLRQAFTFSPQASALNPPRRWARSVIVVVSIAVIVLDLLQLSLTLGARPVWFLPVAATDIWLSPFRTFNSYGLFAVMTTERREIVVEGSNDGANWLPYEFKYKPGDVNRQPAFVAPHQPRLDWQMWFAALGNYEQNPWLGNFSMRLLQGSPEVLALLDKNPFPAHPPRYIRAELYDYHFTGFAERQKTGAWWKREFIGEYLPPISLPE